MGKTRQGGALRQVLLSPIEKFVALESKGGILLLFCTIVALLWANSRTAESYFSLWQTPMQLGFGDFSITKPLVLWINDGLMAIFFFVVGLEIKREFLAGELSTAKKASLPIAAALGGMVVPAALYMIFNAGTAGASGWGIPMATDIAFALGILALLGRRGSPALKVFLTALAIVDDIGAVLVIAFFYTADLAWGSLFIGLGLFTLLLGLGRLKVTNMLVYLGLGLLLWLAFLKSGVHATIAGVLLAFTIPGGSGNATGNGTESSLLHRLEHGLHPWVTYFIIPIFALANAGVALGAEFAGMLGHAISIGIIAGLFFGKIFGVTLFSWVAVRAGWAALPPNVTWLQVAGVSALAGIGFTMSLFIANLAFADPGLIDTAKVGILTASLISALVGSGLLLYTSRQSAPGMASPKQE